MAELMQLHEVREYALETPKPEKHMIWLERRKTKTVEHRQIYCVSGGVGQREALEIDIEDTADTLSLPFSTYKESWRCWTDKPSVEQMRGIRWHHEGRKRRIKTEKDKERQKEYLRKWREKNPTYSRDYMRAYSKTEKHREYWRAYTKTEKYREYQREYKRRKRAVKPDDETDRD